MSDSEVIGQIIDELGRMTETFGLSKVSGQIYGVLYFYGDMNQDDITKNLSVSLSQVSQGLNTLEKLGLVIFSSKNGRKRVYSAEQSFMKVKRRFLENTLLFRFDPMANFLSSRTSEVKNPLLKQKVETLYRNNSNASAFLKLILKVPFGK